MVDRLEALLDQLRARGLRITHARRAVLRAILELDAHPTAEELARAVQRDAPDIHQATVYRTLAQLSTAGLVAHVHLGHGPAVYHLAETRHQHLVCDSCGLVIEAPADLFGELTRRLDDRYGFELRPDHFALGGRCASCRVPS